MNNKNISSKSSEKKVNRLRDKMFSVRLTSSEFEKVNKKIEKSHLGRAEFLMKIISKKEIIVINEIDKMLIEAQKQGVNLNQIAKALNGYYLQLKQFGLETYSIEEDFQRFYSEVLKLRKENQKTVEMLEEILERTK